CFMSVAKIGNKRLKIRAAQTTFGGLSGNAKLVHGGSRSHAKCKRIILKNKCVHVVFKSKRATGKWSFLSFRHRVWIENLLRTKGKKFGVVINDYANVGNHLHVKVKTAHPRLFKDFLRSTSALIARRVSGARRGHKVGKFWDG